MTDVTPGADSPAEGEVLIATVGGTFMVRGALQDVMKRLSAEEWALFELVEGGDTVAIRSSHVVGLRSGSRHRRGSIGFHR
jgi:hypothetical protein